MRHNRFRLLHWTEARTPTVRAVRAWRQLLPDWTPTLDALRSLENMPHEHRAAVAVITDGWSTDDARWDVLMALLEYERRDASMRHRLADEGKTFRETVAGTMRAADEAYERMRSNSEVTVETPLPGCPCACHVCDDSPCDDCTNEPAGLTLVPKPGTPRVFTVRTLASLRKEQGVSIPPDDEKMRQHPEVHIHRWTPVKNEWREVVGEECECGAYQTV